MVITPKVWKTRGLLCFNPIIIKNGLLFADQSYCCVVEYPSDHNHILVLFSFIFYISVEYNSGNDKKYIIL